VLPIIESNGGMPRKVSLLKKSYKYFKILIYCTLDQAIFSNIKFSISNQANVLDIIA